MSAPKSIKGDTIGAGDCFIAGLLYECKKLGILTPDAIKKIPKDSLQQALKIADLVAGHNCQHFGCNPPKKRNHYIAY